MLEDTDSQRGSIWDACELSEALHIEGLQDVKAFVDALVTPKDSAPAVENPPETQVAAEVTLGAGTAPEEQPTSAGEIRRSGRKKPR